jgi:hypothetical protein
MTRPTLNVYFTKDLGIDPRDGKYTIMCEETTYNVQFRNKRELERAIKSGDIYKVDWGMATQ